MEGVLTNDAVINGDNDNRVINVSLFSQLKRFGNTLNRKYSLYLDYDRFMPTINQLKKGKHVILAGEEDCHLLQKDEERKFFVSLLKFTD